MKMLFYLGLITGTLALTACQDNVSQYNFQNTGSSLANCSQDAPQCRATGSDNCAACCAQRCGSESSTASCTNTYCPYVLNAAPLN